MVREIKLIYNPIDDKEFTSAIGFILTLDYGPAM